MSRGEPMDVAIGLLIILASLEGCVGIPEEYDRLEREVMAMNLGIGKLHEIINDSKIDNGEKEKLLKGLEEIKKHSDEAIRLLVIIRSKLSARIPEPLASEIITIIKEAIGEISQDN